MITHIVVALRGRHLPSFPPASFTCSLSEPSVDVNVRVLLTVGVVDYTGATSFGLASVDKMGKGRAEPGTPKYIANKIKSKGLQKLRWFCQMCSKQCRDENGFKCHTMSESHQRQLLLFADNAGRYLSEFSYDFSKGFLFLLKRQFGTKRVKANKVYQEYISDRTHLHMNATQWTTLTGFVKWLGKTGIIIYNVHTM